MNSCTHNQESSTNPHRDLYNTIIDQAKKGGPVNEHGDYVYETRHPDKEVTNLRFTYKSDGTATAEALHEDDPDECPLVRYVVGPDSRGMLFYRPDKDSVKLQEIPIDSNHIRMLLEDFSRLETTRPDATIIHRLKSLGHKALSKFFK